MSKIFADVSADPQEAFLSRRDLMPPQIPNLQAQSLGELEHELRQPLSAIEALAYFLELTSENDKIRGHLQRIQALVAQANQILERSCGVEPQEH